ncbi:MAG: undecaprenyl-phosphate glucose phosphotransferase [Pseudomonadota bacterium]
MLPGIALLWDQVALLLTAVIGYLGWVGYNPVTVEYYLVALIFIGFCVVALFRHAGLYEIDAIMRPISRSDQVLAGVATAFLLFLAVAFSLKVSDIYSRIWLYSFAVGGAVSIFAGRLLLYRLLRGLSRRGAVGRNLVVLGGGEQSRRFISRLGETQPYFTSLSGVFAPDHEQLGPRFGGQPVLGGIERLIAEVRAGRIDDVVVAMPWNADTQLAETVERLKELPVNVYIASDLAGFALAFRPALGPFAALPMFEVVQRPISGWSVVLKSIEDYLLAGIAVLLLGPLLLAVAVAIKLDSPGPVFFKQKRLGFNNKMFEIYKFRSMYHRDVPEARVAQATRDDPRITRVGRFIRATSIDELPQLLNVLNGTMSLVGPRPHALDHNEEYGRQIRGYFARHKVKPGITGWAQVRGLRGETKELEKMEARVRHDTYYAENWSLAFDFRILVMTVLVVLFQRNAY